jgi:hypothetical protein
MTRIACPIVVFALVVAGCTGAKLRVPRGGGPPLDAGDDAIAEPLDGEPPDGAIGDGPASADGGAESGIVTVWPVDAGPLPSPGAGLRIRARLYSDIEYLSETWPAATTAEADDGASGQVVYDCAPAPRPDTVILQTFLNTATLPWLRLTAGPDGSLRGWYARSEPPAVECQVLNGRIDVTLADRGALPPGEQARADRAVGTFEAPCWVQGNGADGGLSLASITLKGTFDLPVRRSRLACPP